MKQVPGQRLVEGPNQTEIVKAIFKMGRVIGANHAKSQKERGKHVKV